jgi:predicted dehydrogenase
MTRQNGTNGTKRLEAGVIGVGSMGAHHARVYSELPGVSLTGVTDVDQERAATVAKKHGTRAYSRAELLEQVDIVSLAVPTEHHFDVGMECIEAGVDTLVEKPFVDDVDHGRALARQARNAGIILQVGHIERFNPAVRVLEDIVPDLDIVAVDIQRLGPPVERAVADSVVYDLMVHDIDLLLMLLDTEIETLSATASTDQHVSAHLTFDDGSIGDLTASRLTQQKIRTLSITAKQSRVNVDLIERSVEIHRQSLPEYVEQNGDVRYRHESVVERPVVESGNPLKRELRSFIDAARTRSEPVVTAEDGLRAIEIADRIEEAALGPVREIPQ